METTFNRLTIKSLLLDAITYYKFKQHLAPGWKQAKTMLCVQAGRKPTINNIQFIRLLGLIYQDNGLCAEFDEIIAKNGLSKVVYN